MSQDWVGWFRLRYTSTLFHPLGSHARGLLSTAEEFFVRSKIPVYRQVGKSKEQKSIRFGISSFNCRYGPMLPGSGAMEIKMQRERVVVGWINYAGSPGPEVTLTDLGGLSLSELQNHWSDINSKGTTRSSAVKAERLEELLGEEERGTLMALLKLELSMAGADGGGTCAISDLIDALLTAGAKMALRTPGIETLLPAPK